MSDIETLEAEVREAELRAESGRVAFNEMRDRYADNLDSLNAARLALWRARREMEPLDEALGL